MAKNWLRYRPPMGEPVQWVHKCSGFAMTTLDGCVACLPGPLHGEGPMTLSFVGTDMLRPGLAKPAKPLDLINALRRRDVAFALDSGIAAAIGQMWLGRRGFICSFPLLSWAYRFFSMVLANAEKTDPANGSAAACERYIDAASRSLAMEAEVVRIQFEALDAPLRSDWDRHAPWLAGALLMDSLDAAALGAYACSVIDFDNGLAELKCMWPTDEQILQRVAEHDRPEPNLGDLIQHGSKELVVISTDPPANRYELQVIELESRQVLNVMLGSISPHATWKKVDQVVWVEMMETACKKGECWQLGPMLDHYRAAGDHLRATMINLAIARASKDAVVQQRIARSIAESVAACSDEDRAELGRMFREIHPIIRMKGKGSVSYLKAPEEAMRAAVRWGHRPNAKAVPATPPLTTKAPPVRLNPKLQGAGRVKGRSQAAPTGTSHRIVEIEWDVRADAIGDLQQMTFTWFEDKLGTTLPKRWREGHHEFNHHALRLETEFMGGLFAFRFEHPDGRIAGRRWRVEGTLIRDGDQGGAGIRLIAVDHSKSLGAVPYSVPGIAQRWLSTGALSSMKRDPREVWLLQSAVDFFTFRNIAGDDDRVVGFLVTAGSSCPDIPPHLVGTTVHAHLDDEQAGQYARRFGATPAEGQVHLFPSMTSSPTAMPFTTGIDMEAAVRAATVRKVKLPEFSEVRQQIRAAQVDSARHQGAASITSAGHAVQPDEQMVVAKVDTDAEEMLAIAQDDLDLAYQRLERQDSELREALHTIRALKLRLGDEVIEVPAEPAPLPDSFDHLPKFAKALRPRVVVSAKALKSANECKDNFQEQALVFKTLQALSTHYWEMRFGDRDAHLKRWQEFLQENHLTFGPVGIAVDSSKYGQAYRVKVDGQIYPLDLHVQGSSTRDPSRCLRVYLHADEAKQRVVIGHLPSHLDNHLT